MLRIFKEALEQEEMENKMKKNTSKVKIFNLLKSKSNKIQRHSNRNLKNKKRAKTRLRKSLLNQKMSQVLLNQTKRKLALTIKLLAANSKSKFINSWT